MDDPFLIMFTSGSTGQPKLIELTNFKLVNMVLTDARGMYLTKTSRNFNDCPFEWLPAMCDGVGFVYTIGCTMIVFPPKLGLKGGATSVILETMAEEKCTHAFTLPLFYYDMVHQGVPSVIDLSSMKYCATGGQHLSESFVRALLNVLPTEANVINVYGSTETQFLATQTFNRKNIDRKDLEVGCKQIMNGYEMKIVDSEGKLVPMGEKGNVRNHVQMHVQSHVHVQNHEK